MFAWGSRKGGPAEPGARGAGEHAGCRRRGARGVDSADRLPLRILIWVYLIPVWQRCFIFLAKVYLERTNGTPAGSARAHATRGAAAGCSVQRAVRHAHVRSRTAHAPPRSRTRRAVQIMRGIILNMIQESFMKKATSLNAHSLRNLTVLRNTHLNNTQPPETSSSAHRTGRRRA